MQCEDPKKRQRVCRFLAGMLVWWVGATGLGSAWGQSKEPSNLQVSIWASSCMACHGPEGRAEGTGLTIGGRSADDLLGKLLGYRSGNLRATIMHQHTKGYSDSELKRIAEYFASLK